MALDSVWFGLRMDIWQQLISLLFLMVILIPAALGDLKQQKVPNWLSMSGWILGPLLALSCTGVSGLTDAILGLGFMVVLLFPLWMLHLFGAADVKLMGTVGSLSGISAAPTILLGVLLVGMLMSIALLVYKRRLIGVLFRLMTNPGEIFGKRGVGSRESELTSGIILPYAIPIAFGTMLTILYMQL